MHCKDIEPVAGCWLKADGSTESVVIHYTYGVNAAGVEIIASTRYTTADGTPVALAAGETVTPGVCSPSFAISHTEAGCANGVPWTRRTTLVRNAANDIVATLVSYVDSSGAATATFPAGFQLGACPLPAEPAATPHGADIPNSTAAWAFPVAQVRTFTVTREGNGLVVVTTPSGAVTLHRNGSRTWGSGDGAALIDVSGISIQTGAGSNADVIWEV